MNIDGAAHIYLLVLFLMHEFFQNMSFTFDSSKIALVTTIKHMPTIAAHFPTLNSHQPILFSLFFVNIFKVNIFL